MGNIIRAQTGEVLRSPTVAIEKVSGSGSLSNVQSQRDCEHWSQLPTSAGPARPRGADAARGPAKNAGARPADIGCLIDLASGPRNRRDRPTLGGNNGRETRRVQPKSKRTIKHVVSVHKEKSFHPLRLSVGKNFGQGRATSSGPADIPGRRRAIDPFMAPARPAVQWSGAG
jgi:hypothetical protein